MTSKERMLASIECRDVDYIPCSFMLFFNLYEKCASDEEFVEKQLEMGLDPFVHVGHLGENLHLRGTPSSEVRFKEWVEVRNDRKYFMRKIETPAGELTSRVRQWNGWPREDDFPIFSDWLIPRSEEFLVKPRKDLDKLRYIFHEFSREDVEKLEQEALKSRELAERYNLFLVGGWKGNIRPGLQVDPGVMGADAMAWLSGYEEIMVLSLTEPEIIEEYMQIIHEWNMRQIRIYLEKTEAELIIRRGWYETTEFWTPEVYRKIIYPTLKAEADLVHSAGRKYGYIITSAFLPVLDFILDAGIDVLIGYDPLEGKGTPMNIVKEKFNAKKKAIWGGVSGAITVELGTEEETRQAVIEALKIIGRGSGFILSPVDNVRENTERAWRNTRVFIETWKKYRDKFLI